MCCLSGLWWQRTAQQHPPANKRCCFCLQTSYARASVAIDSTITAPALLRGVLRKPWQGTPFPLVNPPGRSPQWVLARSGPGACPLACPAGSDHIVSHLASSRREPGLGSCRHLETWRVMPFHRDALRHRSEFPQHRPLQKTPVFCPRPGSPELRFAGQLRHRLSARGHRLSPGWQRRARAAGPGLAVPPPPGQAAGRARRAAAAGGGGRMVSGRPGGGWGGCGDPRGQAGSWDPPPAPAGAPGRGAGASRDRPRTDRPLLSGTERETDRSWPQ